MILLRTDDSVYINLPRVIPAACRILGLWFLEKHNSEFWNRNTPALTKYTGAKQESLCKALANTTCLKMAHPSQEAYEN